MFVANASPSATGPAEGAAFSSCAPASGPALRRARACLDPLASVQSVASVARARSR
jgi:hypothetical protein